MPGGQGDGTRVTAEGLIAQRAGVLQARIDKEPPLSALPGGFVVSKRGQGQMAHVIAVNVHTAVGHHLA
ncbi:MAG: hypothetical protein AAFW87_14555, partial [Pseudomonadota bacterium]